MTPEYLQYVEFFLARHRLILEDDDPDYALEFLEESMIVLWDDLDQSQRASLNGIGSDLAWLRRGGKNPPMGRSPEEVSAEDVRELVRTEKEMDWHAHLHCIRLCQAKLSPGEVAMRRASAYSALGFDSVAALFEAFVRNCGDPRWTFGDDRGEHS